MLFSWIVLLLEGLFCFIFRSELPSNNDYVSWCVIGINLVAVVGEIGCKKDDNKAKQLLLAGLLFRFFLMVWDLQCRNIFALPNSGTDSEMFAGAAQNGLLTGDWGRGGMYAKYIAQWYRFFGVQRPIAQYTNVLMSLSLIDIVLGSTNYLHINKHDQTIITTLMCFLPNFAIMNSILLRETIIMLTTTIAVYLYIRWIHENKLVLLIGSIIICCVGAMFHSGAIAPMLGEAFVFVLYDRDNKTIRINRNSIFSIILVVALFFVLQNTVGDTIFSKFQGKESAEDVVATANSYNQGGSAYEAGFKINNSVLSLIVNTPIRMFYFVTSPVPWKWRGTSDVIAFVFSAMVYLYIYYYAINELRRGNNKNKTMIIVLLILSLSTALVFAWGVSNAGTALRHREKFISIYLLLLAVSRSGHTEIVKENDKSSLKPAKVRSIS